MKKKEKEAYIPKTGLLGDAIDYNYYQMTAGVRILCFVAGLLAGGIVGYIFYENVILTCVAGIICGAAAQPIYHKNYIERRKKALTLQFKDMLEALSTSIGAGSNVQDSFASAYKDMVVQYTEDSYIARELWIINAGLHNNLSIEALLLDLGDRSGISDILSFANVFETCYRKGGNIKEVIRNTYQIIADKMDIELEIKTMVASKTSEQNMMLVMPIILVLMLKSMASDIVNLNSLTGWMSTTLAVIMFAAAYMIGRKILSIKV